MSNLDTLETDLLSAIDGADTESALEEVRVHALGKKGKISEQMKTLGKMSPEEALGAADAEVRRVFDRWREAGKV